MTDEELLKLIDERIDVNIKQTMDEFITRFFKELDQRELMFKRKVDAELDAKLEAKLEDDEPPVM